MSLKLNETEIPLDFLRSHQLKNKFLLTIIVVFASCTGGKEATKTASKKVNYPSFESTTLSWKAHANYPATDSLQSVKGAKGNALLLLNEQLVFQLDGLRKKAVSKGNTSLDTKEVKLSLADLRLKEHQVSDWNIQTQKKASIYVTTATAEMLKTDVVNLLKSNQQLAKLVDDTSIATILNPAVQ